MAPIAPQAWLLVVCIEVRDLKVVRRRSSMNRRLNAVVGIYFTGEDNK